MSHFKIVQVRPDNYAVAVCDPIVFESLDETCLTYDIASVAEADGFIDELIDSLRVLKEQLRKCVAMPAK